MKQLGCKIPMPKSLNALKKYSNSDEPIAIVTSNYFSILFYNSEIWHSRYMNQDLKSKIFVDSENALKLCLHYKYNNMSYSDMQITQTN